MRQTKSRTLVDVPDSMLEAAVASVSAYRGDDFAQLPADVGANILLFIALRVMDAVDEGFGLLLSSRDEVQK